MWMSFQEAVSASVCRQYGLLCRITAHRFPAAAAAALRPGKLDCVSRINTACAAIHTQL
jgi:hypothetical protein